MAASVRVLLVEDHDLVRDALAYRLTHAGFVIVATCTTGESACETVRATRCDLVLLDQGLPGMTGIEVAEQIALMPPPKPRVVMLSGYGSPEFTAAAVRAGCSGVLCKGESVDALVVALKTIARGGLYLTGDGAAAAKQLLTPRGADDLAPRERQVLQGIVRGQQNKEIAHSLGLTPETVRSYRATLYEKLGAHNAASVIKAAQARGLLVPVPTATPYS